MTAPIKVGPGIADPTHHIKLTDAFGFEVGLIAVDAKNLPDDKAIRRNPVDRSSLKTSTGQSQYSDLRPPYTTIVQQDWSGGRAAAKFEDDQTKYYDSTRVDTARAARVILQGRETYGQGWRSECRSLPGSMKMVSLVTGRHVLSVRIYPTTSFTLAQAWAWLRYIGNPSTTMTITLRADNSGQVSTILATATVTSGIDLVEPLISKLTLCPLAYAVVSGTYYWLEFTGGATDDEDNHWEVGCNTATGTTYQSATGLNWAAYSVATGLDIYYRLTDAINFGDGQFFVYKGALYFVSKPPDGTAGRLWINGARGCATSNAGDKTKLNAQGSPGWTTNQFVGAVAVITGGTGFAEAQNWRNITANSTGILTVDTPWLITHDTTTEFVILGSDSWVEITGHGLTQPVTDVLSSSQNVVYFCQGDTTNIRRMREYQTGGVWTRQFADDGTNSATFLEEYNENGWMNILRSKGNTTVAKNISQFVQSGVLTSGTMVITGLADTSMFISGMKVTGQGVGPLATINTVDSGTQVTVTVNSTHSWTEDCTFTQGTPVWGTNLKFMPDASIGDNWDRITNLIRYVDESQNEAVWIMKEAGPWVWVGNYLQDSYDRAKLDEFKAVASSKNGRAAAKQGVYLWYSVANSVHRFYSPNLDDVGPTLGEGLPLGRQGNIVAILAYPGRTIIAVDAGSTGYSSVLENNGGSAWHEVYRAPLGQRLYALAFQVVPGPRPDRLWVRQANEMVYIPFPSDTFDPYQDANYTYQHEGVLTLASMYGGLIDAWKNWHTISTHAENLVPGVTWIEIDYKLDDETDWHALPDRFDAGPIATSNFGTDFGGSGKKADIRLRFYSTNMAETPKLLAIIIDAIAVVAPKFSFSFPVKVSVKDLQGQDEDMAPYLRVQQLDTWSGNAQPLLMNCVNPLYDDMKVFLNPLPAGPIDTVQLDGESDYIISVVIQEA